MSIKKERERERKNLVLGVRKLIQQRQLWGHHIRGKGQQGNSRVYRKFSLPYLDSADDDKEEEREKGDSKEEEKEEVSPGTAVS